jgi:hypothetical protein
MTWRPVPQPPCTEPCCTGRALTHPEAPAVAREPEPYQPVLRECGVTGCGHCRPITDPALRQWINDTDPAPAEYPSARLHYGRHIA